MKARDRPRRDAPRQGEVNARERILTTASKLFYREGIPVVGFDTVVERCGVSKIFLYRVFDFKDALITAFAVEKDRLCSGCGAMALRERGSIEAQMGQTDVLGHVDMDEAAVPLASRNTQIAGYGCGSARHRSRPDRCRRCAWQRNHFAPRQQRLPAPRRRPQSPSLMLKRGLLRNR
jgi:hypothetical protein